MPPPAAAASAGASTSTAAIAPSIATTVSAHGLNFVAIEIRLGLVAEVSAAFNRHCGGRRSMSLRGSLAAAHLRALFFQNRFA
jgi:hypothetical protein